MQAFFFLQEKKKKRNILLEKFLKQNNSPRIYRPLLMDMLKYLLRVSYP